MSSRRTSTRDRVHHCTHSRVTRIYDADTDNLRCMMCEQKPLFSWLWRCTQDTDGYLPASDFYPDPEPQKPISDVHLYTLNDSTMAAAQQGHYTDEELDLLWKQKIAVRKLIQQLRPTSSSSASSSLSSTQSSLPPSTTSSSLDSAQDTETETDYSQISDCSLPCRSPLEPIQEVHDDLERDSKMLPTVSPTLAPPCQMRVCHRCRPIFKERSWGSIDGIVKSTFKLPPMHEHHNLPWSDVEVVRQLGIDKEVAALSQAQGFRAQAQRFSQLSFKETVQKLLRDCDEPSSEEIKDCPTLRHTQTCNDLASLARADSIDDTVAKVPAAGIKSSGSKADSL